MPPSSSSRSQRFGPRWIGDRVWLVAIALVAVGLFYWSQGTWPDAVIDFGRELYVPWQLVEGKALYTDLAYFNGPLSPHLNAFWFQLAGVRLDTLVFANTALFALLVVLLYELLLRIGGVWPAAVGGLLVVSLFGFLQLVWIGNYNFICPYSHELTHGLILFVAALACLAVAHVTGRAAFLGAAGLCTGLVFLTKAEVFLAAGLALPLGIALTQWAQRSSVRRGFVMWAGFVAGAFAPPLLAFIALSRSLPAAEAFRAVLGTWPHVLHPEVVNAPFYRRWMGTLDAGASLETIFWWLLGYAAFFGLAYALAWWGPRTPRARAWLAPATLLGAGALLAALPEVPWHEAPRPLPVILLGFLVLLLRQLFRQRGQWTAASGTILLTTLVVFALALLAKMLLLTRFYNYGFALALPAAVVFVVLTVHWIPAQLSRRGGNGAVFRMASVAVLLVVVVGHARLASFHRARSTHPISSGQETFLADVRGASLQRALDFIKAEVEPHETLAAIPGGVMLNFLARRSSSVSYISYAPFDLELYGEQRILEALRKAPPDYIALVHIDFSEDDARFFGVDYGFVLSEWIQQHYAPVKRFGAPPLRTSAFGIALLRRDDSVASP